MRALTVRERDRVSIDATGRDLTEAEAEALFRLDPALPPRMLTWEHRAVRFGQHCGILRAGTLTIEVLPKIRAAADEDARGVLVAMLRAAGHLVESPGAASLSIDACDLLDVFVLDFCERVNNLLRRGAIRTYEVREENLTTVRGRLNLAEHLRRNVLDRGHIHCRFDELSIDNDHNRALKAVLALLLTQLLGTQANGAVNGLLSRMHDVSTKPCTMTHIKSLHFDRISSSWRPIFERAALFMRHLYPDIRAGESEGPGLLFDMERLFEVFVGAKLRQQWRYITDCRVCLQSPQKYFTLARDGPAFRMQPDITVVSSDGGVLRLYDTKWKALDGSKANWGINREDVYQMAAYAARYKCNQLALLYPYGEGIGNGFIDGFVVECPDAPKIEVYTLDLVSLVRGGKPPGCLGPPNES